MLLGRLKFSFVGCLQHIASAHNGILVKAKQISGVSGPSVSSFSILWDVILFRKSSEQLHVLSVSISELFFLMKLCKKAGALHGDVPDLQEDVLREELVRTVCCEATE